MATVLFAVPIKADQEEAVRSLVVVPQPGEA
jgi:hypothetical protein